MILVGWAVLGVVLGAVGSEVLRASKPELVEKVEDAARRFVDCLCPSKSTDQASDSAQEAAEKADEGAGHS